MNSFTQIIALWPSSARLAEDLGVVGGTVRAMKRRDSLPPEYWLHVVQSAQRRNIPGVTLDALARIAAEKGGA